MAKESAVVDAPPAPAKPAQAGDETSKSIFKQARIDAGLEKPAEPPPPPEPDKPLSAPDKKPDDAPPPPAKKKIPADVIDPDKKPDPKVHEAVAEIEAMALPKNAKPEQVASFNTLKTKSAEHLKKALDDAADLRKKLESASTPTAELDGLRTQLKEATDRASGIEERWSKEAFASSPKFQAQFASREQTAIELAKSYLDGTEVKQDIIDLAAHATGRKRLEILKDAGVEDNVITAIMPHLANFDTVQREKKTALDNWKTESKNWQAEAQAASEKARVQRTEQENKVWETIVPKLDLLPFRKSKDNLEWNDRADQLLARAKEVFNGAGAAVPVFAEIVAKGVAYDSQQEVIDHLKTELQNTRTENEKLKSAAPGGSITAGTGDGAPPKEPAPGDKAGREQQQKDTFNSELAKARGS